MNVDLGEKVRIRKPEPKDIDALYTQKNDPEIASMLTGFSTGYSKDDISRWIERHQLSNDELISVISDRSDQCIGHVGLYNIDQHARSASFGIMIGQKASWGQGIGQLCTHWALNLAFDDLGLHRVSLDLLENNKRALSVYESVGFHIEGRLRQAQYKNGQWHDLVLMSILEDEWRDQRRKGLRPVNSVRNEQ